MAATRLDFTQLGGDLVDGHARRHSGSTGDGGEDLIFGANFHFFGMLFVVVDYTTTLALVMPAKITPIMPKSRSILSNPRTLSAVRFLYCANIARQDSKNRTLAQQQDTFCANFRHAQKRDI